MKQTNSVVPAKLGEIHSKQLLRYVRNQLSEEEHTYIRSKLEATEFLQDSLQDILTLLHLGIPEEEIIESEWK